MGTRHLIAAIIDGQYKLAQYGQWDGYPEGQGQDIVNFLRTAPLNQFEAKLRNTRFLDERKIAKLNEPMMGRLYNKFPHLSRDLGSGILKVILDHDINRPLKLRNGLEFAAESLFCEFAYVIDMDHDQLELYTGFNQEPLSQWQRFSEIKSSTPDYYPVRLAAIYKFDNLPTVAQMEKDCESHEDVAELLKKAESFHDSNA